MEQLYLFEILVDKITFGPMFVDIPAKTDIKMGVSFANFIDLEVEVEDLRGFTSFSEQFNPVVKIECGKSHLFPCSPTELHKSLIAAPLDITIGKKDEQLMFGRVAIPWHLEIIQMINNSRSTSNVIPVSTAGEYEVIDAEQTIIGKISIFMRMSCLGPKVQTQFQVVERLDDSGEAVSRKYLFRNANAETTFQAQKYGPEESPSEILPIAPILSPADPKTWCKKGYMSPDDMTAENLKKILCKNKDCPGAQKFKEYGLGPAATGRGLGTVYGQIDVPISYGLSQTYGSLDNYGPYGIYTRPKSVDQPFIPKEPIDCIDFPGCETCGSCNPKNEEERSQGCCCCCNSPLRLTGGAPVEDESTFPVPMMMCKDLMQSYDRVLDAYKKALGPCGRGTCPFSHNVVAESCKRLCPMPGGDPEDPNQSETYNVTMTPAGLAAATAPKDDINILSACGTPGCPHARRASTDSDKDFKNKQMRSACGSPTCPYAKKRLGTATDDDMSQLQHLGAPTCGTPKCPIPLKLPLPPLEPIHWDCPDPLPKGPCRNPQCPLKPKELRYTPKGPCGNEDCPYAVPDYCGGSDCPFGPPQPCPYAQPLPCPFSLCSPPPCTFFPCPPTPPPCPFSPCPPSPCPPFPCPTPPCGACCNPSCPANPPTCGDPFCPLNLPPRPCSGAPPCPFAKPKPCDSPSCPFVKSVEQKGGSICENPECPFVTKKESPCFVASPCGNPNCPFAPKPSSNDQEICENPECPYKQQPSVSSGSNVICGNPECPYKKQPSILSGSICENPACPFAKPPSPCPPGPCPPGPCPPRPCAPPPCGGPCGYPPCGLPPCMQPCSLELGTTRLTVEVGDAECIGGGGDEGAIDITVSQRPGDTDLEPCSQKTCKAKGGTLECGECAGGEICPCTGNEEKEIASKKASDQTSQSVPAISTQPPVQPLQSGTVSDKAISQRKGKKSRKHKKRKTKYMYKLGDLYPGVHIGHRECITPGRNVPSKMGWLWNVHVPCVGLRPRVGWRPGAVGRTVAKMIISHRKAKGLKLLEPLTPKASKKKMKTKYSEYESDSDATVAPKPTLQIKKREGCYFITMNPLKDPKKIEDNENPYMDCTPMQFKITKNKQQATDTKTCYCGDDGEDESSSSDSELDIEFTPPAGVIRPERLKRKKNVVHEETQYIPDDFMPPGGDKGGKKGGGKGKGGKGGKGKKKF